MTRLKTERRPSWCSLRAQFSFERAPTAADLDLRFRTVSVMFENALETVDEHSREEHYQLFLAHGFFPEFCVAQGVDEKVVAEMLSRLGRSGDLRYMPAAIARLARAEGIASAVAGFGVRLADEPAERADA